MKKTLDFLIPNTRENIESLIRQYFWKNGYYELKSQSGLKFAKESGSDVVLSPRRLDHQIEVHISETDAGVRVFVHFKVNELAFHNYPTIIDKEFVEDLLAHFREALSSGRIETFDIDEYERLVKPYSKKYMIITAAIVILGLIPAIYFELNYLVIAVLFIASTIGLLLINQQIAKKRKANS